MFYPTIVVDSDNNIIFGKQVNKKNIDKCQKIPISSLNANEIEQFSNIDKILKRLQDYKKSKEFENIIQKYKNKILDKYETLNFIHDILYFENTVQKVYVSFVELPVYSVDKMTTNLRIEDLYDESKYKKLLNYIDSLQLNEHEKYFLKLTATRFIRFNYKNIADFYLSSENPVLKEAFEKLAIVHLDKNGVINHEYLRLSARILKLFKHEYGHDTSNNQR